MSLCKPPYETTSYLAQFDDIDESTSFVCLIVVLVTTNRSGSCFRSPLKIDLRPILVSFYNVDADVASSNTNLVYSVWQWYCLQGVDMGQLS